MYIQCTFDVLHCTVKDQPSQHNTHGPTTNSKMGALKQLGWIVGIWLLFSCTPFELLGRLLWNMLWFFVDNVAPFVMWLKPYVPYIWATMPFFVIALVIWSLAHIGDFVRFTGRLVRRAVDWMNPEEQREE